MNILNLFDYLGQLYNKRFKDSYYLCSVEGCYRTHREQNIKLINRTDNPLCSIHSFNLEYSNSTLFIDPPKDLQSDKNIY